MARYENRGPVMNLRRNRNQQSTWNTTQGPEGGQRVLPGKFNTATGEPGPATYAETGTKRDDFIPRASAYERNQGIDPATFDVTDPEQVMAFQRQAGLKEDAMFGPNTQKAWEEYVNRRRATEGEEQYDFGVRSLVDLVDEEGKPDDAKIQAQTKRQDYKGDVSTQSNWERFQDSLGDTVSDYFGGFWK